MKKILLLMFFGLSVILSAQENKDRSLYYDFGKKFYCDAYSLPHNSKDSVKVLVLFRYPNSLLSFVKATGASNGSGFIALPHIQVQFRDSNGIIKKREIFKDTITTSDYNDTKTKTTFNYGYLQIILPTGKYSVTAEISDNDKYKIKELSLPELKKIEYFNGNKLGQPFFLNAFNAQETIFKASVLNHGANFSSNSTKILFPAVFKGESAVYKYRIEYVEHQLGNTDWSDSIIISGSVAAEKNISLNISNLSFRNNILFEIKPDSSQNILKSGYSIGLIELEIPPNNNVPGAFQVKLWENNSKDTTITNFKIDWEDMPLSLKKVETAMESMYYVLTDEEFSLMNKGNDRKVFRKLLDYWHAKDPTPFTVYNEAMNEYFRRVDYSMFNFKTLTEINGSKTERGKIYILNGPPSNIKRNMSKESKLFEIWTYANLKKEFTFETNSKGSFSLTKIIDLK